MYEDIHARIGDLTELKRLPTDRIDQLARKHIGLPRDYLAFLAEIGHGDLGNLVIYDAPIDPVVVYSAARSGTLTGIVLFGDDTQGFCYGFDLKKGARVVEIDPRGKVDRSIESGFAEFLRSFLA
jgi:hypothetical protein